MTTGAAEGRVETLGAIPEGSGQKPRVAGSGAANVTGRKATHWPEALHEPPYTEPYVRWCGRTAGVTPPPTRLLFTLVSSLLFANLLFSA